MPSYAPRLVDNLIAGLLSDLPALFIVGPRATGKTTTASRYAETIVRLDNEVKNAAFRADPDAALRRLQEPILLDEWQVVPGVLGAVKRAVDSRPDPGRFLVTGSVRGETSGELWPGTGRLTRISMFGMTIRKQKGNLSTPTFIDRASRGQELLPADPSPDLPGYVELALASGFPEAALRLAGATRERWLESYAEQLITRDAEQVEAGRDPARLRRYFEASALSTAGAVDHKTLYDTAGVDRKTALAYDRLLANLLVLEELPAWTSNRLKRLALVPKRHVIDAALVAAVLRLDVSGILRSGDLLGRLLETFVVSQLRAELVMTNARPRLYHLRQREGRIEVDVVAELAGGSVVAIEVKRLLLQQRTRDTWSPCGIDSARHSGVGSCSTPGLEPFRSVNASWRSRSLRCGPGRPGNLGLWGHTRGGWS
jgi:predicted AAA+ superfamily ATPase